MSVEDVNIVNDCNQNIKYLLTKYGKMSIVELRKKMIEKLQTNIQKINNNVINQRITNEIKTFSGFFGTIVFEGNMGHLSTGDLSDPIKKIKIKEYCDYLKKIDEYIEETNNIISDNNKMNIFGIDEIQPANDNHNGISQSEPDSVHNLRVHVLQLKKDLQEIYNKIVTLKEECKTNLEKSEQKNSDISEKISVLQNTITKNQNELTNYIANLDTTNENKIKIEKKLEEMINVHDEEKNIFNQELRRCAEEKSKIIEQLNEIDTDISEQSSLAIGENGFYKKMKSLFDNQQGGFNWRTAVESKKLMSSKSHKSSNKSSSFLRDKDNKNTKKKTERTSQRSKTKKNKKGIFRNLGLFRKKK